MPVVSYNASDLVKYYGDRSDKRNEKTAGVLLSALGGLMQKKEADAIANKEASEKAALEQAEKDKEAAEVLNEVNKNQNDYEKQSGLANNSPNVSLGNQLQNIGSGLIPYGGRATNREDNNNNNNSVGQTISNVGSNLMQEEEKATTENNTGEPTTDLDREQRRVIYGPLPTKSKGVMPMDGVSGPSPLELDLPPDRKYTYRDYNYNPNNFPLGPESPVLQAPRKRNVFPR